MHLVYIESAKHNYIGQSEYPPVTLMTRVVEEYPVELENAALVTMQRTQNNQLVANQHPLISSKWYHPKVLINPRYVIDIRTVPKDSPLRATYERIMEDVKAGNVGIALVKNMPGNLPPMSKQN